MLPKLDLLRDVPFSCRHGEFFHFDEIAANIARYRRYELSTRFALLYTSVPIAGAVSGLLAGVITQYMDGAAGLPGWRWLFVSHAQLLMLSLTSSDP